MQEADTRDAPGRGATSIPSRIAGLIYGLLLILAGGLLAVGGGRLIALGGSPYYLAAGLAAAAAGAAVILRRWSLGGLIYLGLMAATLIWALAEARLDGWALAPRVLSPAVLGLPFLLGALARGPVRARWAAGLSLAAGVALVAAVATNARYQPAAPPAVKAAAPAASPQDGEWPIYGRVQGGGHYSPLAQINTANAARLERIWTTRLERLPARPAGRSEAVPLKIGDSLYTCSAFNDVSELDPETGKARWTYDARLNAAGILQSKCRGVAYYATPGAAGACAARVYTATGDARLIALDARTGVPCAGFGAGGTVDLKKGQKMRGPGYYGVSSAPVAAQGKIIVGGYVADGQHVGEPSGVIRAFDAVTGKLVWAWDLGNPGHRGEPPEGQYYTPGTPNSWAPMSVDESLGLVYAPLGNATPDYWGGHRSAQSNRYASSLVALDLATGEPRWHFQTTHYDVWDYDLSAQPILYDLPTASGVVPVVVQPSKRGETFVLDRRTGQPVFPVEERPAPQAHAAERLSPTQPWSPAFPSLMGPLLKESSMWGLTAIDQLWCRIKFREARYDGSMTPPGVTYSIADPGYIGGVNWPSASIDPGRRLAFMVSNRIVNYIRLIPRAQADRLGMKADPGGNRGGPVAQEGAAYAADISPFLSPLKVPCQAPPHGLINAVDLTSGRLVWSRPLGSARDLGPMGKPSHLPLTIGTPASGGPMSTAGGLTFVAASRDHAFRVFDSETGRLLFETDLPGSGDTKPMTYLDRTGRQVVAISSNAKGPDGESYSALTAFALPKR